MAKLSTIFIIVLVYFNTVEALFYFINNLVQEKCKSKGPEVLQEFRLQRFSYPFCLQTLHKKISSEIDSKQNKDMIYKERCARRDENLSCFRPYSKIFSKCIANNTTELAEYDELFVKVYEGWQKISCENEAEKKIIQHQKGMNGMSCVLSKVFYGRMCMEKYSHWDNDAEAIGQLCEAGDLFFQCQKGVLEECFDLETKLMFSQMVEVVNDNIPYCLLNGTKLYQQ